MVDYKVIGKKLGIGAGFILSVAAAYYVGLTSRPSFNELTPGIQKAIKEEKNGLDALIRSALANYSRGDLVAASKDLTSAATIATALEKIYPEYQGLTRKLRCFSDLTAETERVTARVNTFVQHTEELTKMAKSGTINSDEVHRRLNSHGFVVSLRDECARCETECPEAAGAAYNTFATLVKSMQEAMLSVEKAVMPAVPTKLTDPQRQEIRSAIRFHLSSTEGMLKTVEGKLAKYK